MTSTCVKRPEKLLAARKNATVWNPPTPLPEAYADAVSVGDVSTELLRLYDPTDPTDPATILTLRFPDVSKLHGLVWAVV